MQGYRSFLRVWAAHVMTAVRIPLAIAFWITYGTPLASLAWVSAAAVSDALDGRLARRARRRAGVPETVPSIGDWLDPAAAKLFVVIALAAIIAHDRDAWILVAVLGARELVLVPILVGYQISRVFGGRAIELRAHPIGKAATVMQFLAVVVIVAPLTALQWPFAIIAGALGVAAVIDQLARARPPRPFAPRAAPNSASTPELTHALAPHYPALRAIRTRRALETSTLWRDIGPEVERVLDGIERRDHPSEPPAKTLRAVAWNIQRGTNLDALIAALTTDPELARAAPGPRRRL